MAFELHNIANFLFITWRAVYLTSRRYSLETILDVNHESDQRTLWAVRAGRLVILELSCAIAKQLCAQ